MAFLNPVLGNTRQEILTPEEAKRVAAPTPSVIGQNYQVDRDQFKNINLDLAISGGIGAIEEAKSRSQTTAGLVGKGVGNVVGTALFEIAKMPGYAVGGLKSLATGDIEDMINGSYLQGVKAVQDATQNKWFEIQTPKEVEEGNLLKQLSNPYFWASEGANGVGFLLSFLVPGQAVKAFGLGAKGASALGRAGKLAEVIADGEKIIQGGNAFGRIMLKTLGKSGRALDFGKVASNIESSLAVTVNTIFESAAEASELFDTMTSQGSTNEEASLAASQAFKMNLGLLAVSNALVEKYIFDGFGRSMLKPRKLTSEVIAGAKEIEKSLFKASIRKMPFALGAGVAQEGFFEEGMQTSISQTKGGGIGEVLEQYSKNISTMFSDDPESLEFAKSVVLGGVLGGGMSTIGAVGEAKRENNFLFGTQAADPSKLKKFFGYKAAEASKGAIELMRDGYKALKADKSELFKMDASGKILGFQPGAQDKLTEAGNLELMSNYYNDLLVENAGNVESTDKSFVEAMKEAGAKPEEAVAFKDIVKAPDSLSSEEAIAYVQHLGHKRYLDNFLNMEGGAQVAEAHIEDMVQAMEDRYEANTGVKMKPEQVADVKARLDKELKSSMKLHEFIQADHHQSRIGFNPIKENDEDPQKTLTKYTAFFNRAKHARLELLRDIDHFEDRKKEMMTNPVESPTAERDVEDMDALIQSMKDRYAKMSTKKGLKELWDKWTGGQKAIEEIQQAEEAQEAIEAATAEPAMTRDEFWGAAEAAGYAIETNPDGTKSIKDDVNIHVKGKDGKPKILSAVKDGSGKSKISLMDAENPKKVRLFDNLAAVIKELGALKIIDRQEIIKARQARKEAEALAKAKQVEETTRLAMIDKLDELARVDKSIETQIEQLDADIDAKIKALRKIKKPSDPEVKAMQQTLKSEIAKLTKLRDELIEKRKILDAQIDTLSRYIETMKTMSLAEIRENEKNRQESVDPAYLGEFVDYDLVGLVDAVKEIDQIISDYDERIAYFMRLVDVLTDMSSRYDANIEALGKEYTEAFKTKYSYPHPKTGEPVNPPVMDKEVNNVAQGKMLIRMDKHLDKVALQSGVDSKDLRKQFIEDAKNLQAARVLLSHLSKGDQLALIAEKMDDLKKGLEDQIQQMYDASLDAQQKRVGVDSLKRIAALKTLTGELNRKFRDRQRQTFLKNPDKAQVVSQNDGGDNNYTPKPVTEEDPFFGHALASELYGTTGVSIMYTKTGEDLYEPQGDQMMPVANPEKSQKTFFKWIETADTSKFKVEARVAFYDERDGEMQEFYKKANPAKNRKPGEDIFAVIVDKSGAVMKVDNVPLFTGIRRADTKFPQKGAPRMNMYSLMGQYLSDGLGLSFVLTREGMTSDKSAQKLISYKDREAIAKALGVTLDDVNKMNVGQVMKELESKAIGWGREKYNEFLSYIRLGYAPGERAVILPVQGITQGHPVRVLDQNGEVVTYNIQQSMGLELHLNGKPKNFRILKANYKGNITIGNEIKGGFQPGVIYIKKHGSNQIVPIINDSLADNEVELVMMILAKMAGQFSLKGTAGVDFATEYPAEMSLNVNGQIYGQGKEVSLFPQVEDKFSIINMLMMWGSNSANGAADIFIKDGVLFYGNASIAMETLARNTKTEDGAFSVEGDAIKVKEFLRGRRFHISYDMLNSAQVNGGKYYHPTFDRAKQAIVFTEHPSYVEYLFSRTKTDVVPREILDKFGLPQFAQRNIQFRDPQVREEKKKAVGKVAKVSKPAAKPVPAPKTPAGKSDLGKKLLAGLTPAGEKRLEELIEKAKIPRETLVDLVERGSERFEEVEALGIVPKPKSDDVFENVKYRKKIIDLGATWNLLEAVGALSETKEAPAKAPEKTKAEVKPDSTPATPTTKSVESLAPISVEDAIAAQASGKAQDLVNRKFEELIASGYTQEEVLEMIESGVVAAQSAVQASSAIPVLDKDADLFTSMKRRTQISESAELFALMSISPKSVAPAAESPASVSDEEAKERLEKMRRDARAREGIKTKGRFDNKRDSDPGLDQRLSSTELLDKLMEDGIIEQKCN